MFPCLGPETHRKLERSSQLLSLGIFRNQASSLYRIQFRNLAAQEFNRQYLPWLQTSPRKTAATRNQSFDMIFARVIPVRIMYFENVPLEKCPKMVSCQNLLFIQSFCETQLTQRPFRVQLTPFRGVSVAHSDSSFVRCMHDSPIICWRLWCLWSIRVR